MKRKIWMDSGAFSSFTLGEKQDLGAYCSFLKRWGKYIDHAAVLDVIGSAEGTWENQLKMEERGVRPVPCFHYGEDPKWLVKYIERYDYVALGGMVPISTKDLIPWLDNIWENYLTDSEGMPVIKVHGFGLTTFNLMERYPWYSVDSSSWLQSGGFGIILVMDEEGELFRISVSDRSPNMATKGAHYLSETPANKAALERMVKRYGFTMAELMAHHEPRRILCAVVYKEWADRWRLKPFISATWDLATFPSAKPRRKVDLWSGLEIYFAGDVTLGCESRLYKHDLCRMFTYHLLKKKPGRNWMACCSVIDGAPFPPAKEYAHDNQP